MKRKQQQPAARTGARGRYQTHDQESRVRRSRAPVSADHWQTNKSNTMMLKDTDAVRTSQPHRGPDCWSNPSCTHRTNKNHQESHKFNNLQRPKMAPFSLNSQSSQSRFRLTIPTKRGTFGLSANSRLLFLREDLCIVVSDSSGTSGPKVMLETEASHGCFLGFQVWRGARGLPGSRPSAITN